MRRFDGGLERKKVQLFTRALDGVYLCFDVIPSVQSLGGHWTVTIRTFKFKVFKQTEFSKFSVT